MARGAPPPPQDPEPTTAGTEGARTPHCTWLYRRGAWHRVEHRGLITVVVIDGHVDVVSVPDVDSPVGPPIFRALGPNDIERLLRQKGTQDD